MTTSKSGHSWIDRFLADPKPPSRVEVCSDADVQWLVLPPPRVPQRRPVSSRLRVQRGWGRLEVSLAASAAAAALLLIGILL